MSEFNKFIAEIQKNGLEAYGLFYSVYKGTVSDNDDPENLARLKIKVPQIYKDVVPDVWVKPRGMMAGANHGFIYVPEPGDPIMITFENGNPRFPLWEHGWITEGNKPKDFKKSVYVWQSPKEGKIVLNDNDGSITIENKSGYKVVLESDGIFIGNSTLNLGKFFDQLFQLFEVTSAGPYPFTNVAAYTALKQTIQLFLKS